MWLDDRVLNGFKDFLFRGNVVDLAVAVVIGSAFTAVVTSFADSFLRPLIELLGGGGEFGGVLVVDGQRFTWGAFLSTVITFVLTAAIVYFLVILPVHRLFARRARGEEPGPVGPTELDLLVEIRDLLRAQQVGTGWNGPPAGSRREPASGGEQEGP
ncbi:large conductance mechanosensitive channel protein MscL [Blastococcus sp. SYSU DS0552]